MSSRVDIKLFNRTVEVLYLLYRLDLMKFSYFYGLYGSFQFLVISNEAKPADGITALRVLIVKLYSRR